jgi:hypothetical protein
MKSLHLQTSYKRIFPYFLPFTASAFNLLLIPNRSTSVIASGFYSGGGGGYSVLTSAVTPPTMVENSMTFLRPSK